MELMKQFSRFRLLYVEDDDGLREVNLRFFKRIFHTVYEASNGKEGLKVYESCKPDIIITDLKMPIMDGLSMVKQIREYDTQTKIIITTAFTDEQQLIDAVELQIVRYVLKPLNQRNLMPALEKAIKELGVLRRLNIAESIELDTQTNTLFIKEEEFRLTKKEFLFLELLALNPNRTISYTEIESKVWQNEAMSVHSLRTMVGSIRKKFSLEKQIKNVSGLGYSLEIQ